MVFVVGSVFSAVRSVRKHIVSSCEVGKDDSRFLQRVGWVVRDPASAKESAATCKPLSNGWRTEP
eukprot:4503619-Amphidinium_carterae.1